MKEKLLPLGQKSRIWVLPVSFGRDKTLNCRKQRITRIWYCSSLKNWCNWTCQSPGKDRLQREGKSPEWDGTHWPLHCPTWSCAAVYKSSLLCQTTILTQKVWLFFSLYSRFCHLYTNLDEPVKRESQLRNFFISLPCGQDFGGIFLIAHRCERVRPRVGGVIPRQVGRSVQYKKGSWASQQN